MADKTYPTRNLAAYDAYLRWRAEQEKSGAIQVQEQARKYFLEAVALDPQFALAWAQLSLTCTRVIGGRADFSAENITQARAAATAAARFGSELPETLLATSRVKSLLDYDLEGAGRDLDRANQIRPNDARTTALRAILAFAQGDWDQTIALGKKAIELNPRDGDLLSVAGLRLYQHGSYAESRELIERIFAIYPDSPSNAYRHRGIIEWRATGNAEAALAQHERTPVGVRDSLFFRDPANLRLQKRDLRGAIADFAQARDLARKEAPSYISRLTLVQALLGLGETAGGLGDRAQAAAYMAEALPLADALTEDFPTSVAAVIALARIQAARDERAAALATCDRALALALRTRTTLDILFARETAVALWTALGRKDEAIAMLRTLHDSGFAYGYGLRDPQ